MKAVIYLKWRFLDNLYYFETCPYLFTILSTGLVIESLESAIYVSSPTVRSRSNPVSFLNQLI